MSPHTTASCPHDIGPGTSVCLRCRRDARIAARARHRFLLTRLGAIGLALGGVAAAGTAGANALQARRAAEPAPRIVEVRTPDTASAREPAAAEAPRAAAPMGAQAPMSPALANGRAELRDGMYAERDGGTVTVHFDTPGTRTRRNDKFEAVVRATLAQVYGPPADSLLATIAQGALVRGGSLLTELPARGIRLPLASGWALTIWPETRPGQDGPLVVAYRAAVTR